MKQEKDAEVLAHLVSPEAPADAVAAYYTYWHPETRRVLHRDPAPGLLVEAEGRFGPVAVLRAERSSVVPSLLARISPGRRYLIAPWELAEEVLAQVSSEKMERNRVFWLPPGVRLWAPPTEGTAVRTGEGVILRIQEEDASHCRLIWRSPRFAEISVATKPEFRGRGLALAAVAEMSEWLKEQGVCPVYIASVENLPSLRVAARLGFACCYADELAGYVEIAPDGGIGSS